MTTSTIRILLVDDHPTMLWGLERLIESAAPAMQLAGTASDCERALQLAAELRPDVIVLDLDLDGHSSTNILPGLLANGVSRVLILSGNRDQAALSQAVLYGARGVVGKQSPPAMVLEAIRKVHQGQHCLDAELMTVLLGALAPAPAAKADPETARIAALTPKERKIIQEVVEGNGAPNKIIAERLFIAEHTLRNNLTTIYQKLGVANRLELYVYATRRGLGPQPA